MPGIAPQRILTFEKVRAPSSSLLGERLTIALGDEGYDPVVTDEPVTTAGATLACQVVADAGGQLHRGELLARLVAPPAASVVLAPLASQARTGRPMASAGRPGR